MSKKGYTFEELKDVFDRADLNNPNKEDRDRCEAVLVEIGFVDNEGAILPLFDNTYKTTDGYTLIDLEKYCIDECGL